MSFPETPRVVYDQNPLEEVLCQLRFPTILQIGAEDPAAFQETIRQGYPLYNREGDGEWVTGMPGMPKAIADIVAQIPMGKRSQDVTHKFLTEDSARFISLAPEFLAVTETNYERWEIFKEQISLARGALEEEYRPSFYSRIGLRYVDIIDKERIGLSEATWDSLISPAVVGMLGDSDIGNSVREISSAVLMDLDHQEVPGGKIRVRHGVVKTDGDREAYKIDVDLFTAERSGGDNVIRILDIFNRTAGYFFRWAITETLGDALGPREIR